MRGVEDTRWQAPFLEHLAENGNIARAAEIANVARATVYNYRGSDPEFEAKVRAALDHAIERLEEEARRRAYQGTLKPVFYRGEQCGEIQEYSDTLMIFLLKAHRPAVYRERYEFSGPAGGPIEFKAQPPPEENPLERVRSVLGILAEAGVIGPGADPGADPSA